MPRKRKYNSPRFLIVKFARKYGIDPRAALAVARTEGGLRWGAVGDKGTSFGPFQLHIGGALPAGKGPEWANSPQGIEYAIRKMAESGARGLRGRRAIEAIIRNFERPADPGHSIAKAIEFYTGEGTRTPMPFRAADFKSAVSTFFTTPAQYLDVADQFFSAALTGTSVNPTSIYLSLRPKKITTRATRATIDRRKTNRSIIPPLITSNDGKSEFLLVDPEGAPSRSGVRYHAAKDWFAPAGSPVFSPINGKIVEIRPAQEYTGQVYGGVVKVQGRDGKVFVFRHVDPLNLKVGRRIRIGTQIASISPWRDGSPHAHIEVWKTLSGGYTFENMIDPNTIF